MFNFQWHFLVENAGESIKTSRSFYSVIPMIWEFYADPLHFLLKSIIKRKSALLP